MGIFKLKAPFKPAGSQPEAIKQLIAQRPGVSTLLGVTGSGKTFTMAHVIEAQNNPVLIISPNKTLAAQLYEEFSLFFPENKVCYFVSYYDYYQPESYLPAQDIYIAKETKINVEIERLRIEASASLVNRPDTIVIASVSAIYALGDPRDYRNLAFSLRVGQKIKRSDLLHKLVYIQYERNDIERAPGTFWVIGNIIEVYLPYQKDLLRIELFGDLIDGLSWISKDQRTIVKKLDDTVIFPAKHFVITPEKKESALKSIEHELYETLSKMDNPVYKDRLEKRVLHDIEMIQQVGYCSGIENYSSHFDGRAMGQAPYCLFDFFPDNFLCIVDESHITLPQMRGMYAGDKARKKSLIEFGFRLPSAANNRPLMFEESEKFLKNVVYVSATPGPYELAHSQKVVEQVIRPTGIVDPIVEVVPRLGQMDHLYNQIKDVAKQDGRVLITVLTKRLAEDLARYLQERQVKVCYLHSDIKTPERTELLQKLRAGIFDCLVGVNLLREGLDLPEVSLVAIMDADVESFLRDKRSLIQTIGRAARNIDAKVLLYADKITDSMRTAMDETSRRRTLQQEYNKEHGIVPLAVKRDVVKSIALQAAIKKASKYKDKKAKEEIDTATFKDVASLKADLEYRMQKAAEDLDFETAIALRDQWLKL